MREIATASSSPTSTNRCSRAPGRRSGTWWSYLDGVRELILPELEDRPLSVIRVHRGQEAFMQKNVSTYTPARVRTVQFWAETSKREVSYALCNDRRTLL